MTDFPEAGNGSKFTMANPLHREAVASPAALPVLRVATSAESRARMGSTQSWKDIGVAMVPETGAANASEAGGSGRAAVRKSPDSAITLTRAGSSVAEL